MKALYIILGIIAVIFINQFIHYLIPIVARILIFLFWKPPVKRKIPKVKVVDTSNRYPYTSFLLTVLFTVMLCLAIAMTIALSTHFSVEYKARGMTTIVFILLWSAIFVTFLAYLDYVGEKIESPKYIVMSLLFILGFLFLLYYRIRVLQQCNLYRSYFNDYTYWSVVQYWSSDELHYFINELLISHNILETMPIPVKDALVHTCRSPTTIWLYLQPMIPYVKTIYDYDENFMAAFKLRQILIATALPPFFQLTFMLLLPSLSGKYIFSSLISYFLVARMATVTPFSNLNPTLLLDLKAYNNPVVLKKPLEFIIVQLELIQKSLDTLKIELPLYYQKKLDMCNERLRIPEKYNQLDIITELYSIQLYLKSCNVQAAEVICDYVILLSY